MAILKIKNSIIMVLLLCFISACSNNYGRYQQKHDSTPTRLPNNSELHDATPRAEAHSRGGNKHYQVRGKHYQVLKSAQGFTATGEASWYGRKFHGHLTANGEIYDMYAMSAAHKNLPLPTYLKVVNNNNGRSVVVRVNDRGPFHQSRIIDLSYSAAHKLDMLKTGTTNVTITAITDFSTQAVATRKSEKAMPAKVIIPAAVSTIPTQESSLAQTANTTATEQQKTNATIATTPHQITVPKKSKNTNLSGKYIQVFASKSQDKANKVANTLADLHQQNPQLEQTNGIFRVLIGPIKQQGTITTLLLSIKNNGYQNAFVRQLN
jgi:rare lipoprotein A